MREYGVIVNNVIYRTHDTPYERMMGLHDIILRK